jgi:hypothetical protein
MPDSIESGAEPPVTTDQLTIDVPALNAVLRLEPHQQRAPEHCADR